MSDHSILLSEEHAQFTRLYSDHHRWLFNWLNKKLGCHNQAENLAQDTFFRLLGLTDLTHIEEPRAFLATTASRLIVDHARKAKLEKRYLEMYHFYHPEQQATISEEELAIVIEALNLVVNMLDGLPKLCQKAFLLNRLDGKKHAEIATELGISKHTVKKYIAKAMLQCYELVYPN